MKLNTFFPGQNQPFEGNRTLTLRTLPADAQIVTAKIVVTPLRNRDFFPNDFGEMLSVNSSEDNWGTTSSTGNNTSSRWVEVDFHARRTLQSIRGSGTGELQIDLGGIFNTIADDGTFLSNEDGDSFTVALSTMSDAALPGLTAQRIRLVDREEPLQFINVTSVRVLSVPTNVSLALDQQPPFWTRTGEMIESTTTTDFADLLQLYLAEAETEGGAYIIPLTLHSDTIARLDLSVEIEYLRTNSLLPAAVTEVKQQFDFDGVAEDAQSDLMIALPPGARVIPGRTSGQVQGTFADSRILFGPTGKIESQRSAMITPQRGLATPILFEQNLTASAIDLLLASQSVAATLNLNLREDNDGKPADAPLLAQSIQIDLHRNQAQGADLPPKRSWVSVSLPEEFQFKAQTRYWLTLLSSSGDAEWSVETLPAQTKGSMDVGAQFTESGGLAWRTERTANTQSPVAAFFRLRHTPSTFAMPIEIEVGDGEAAERLSLERFAPTGRIDFDLGFDDFAHVINRVADRVAPTQCPEEEHLENGDFSKILFNQSENTIIEEWETIGGSVGVDGVIFIRSQGEAPGGIAQVVPVSGGCPYQLEIAAVTRGHQGFVEIIWRGDGCQAQRTDRLAIREDDYGTCEFTGPQVHRLRMSAPADATQAEVRILAIPDTEQTATFSPTTTVEALHISLRGTRESIQNGDLADAYDDLPQGWQIVPEEAQADLFINIDSFGEEGGHARVRNGGVGEITLSQEIALLPNQTYRFSANGNETSDTTLRLPSQIEVTWQDDSGAAADEPLKYALMPDSASVFKEGSVPNGATSVNIEITIQSSSEIVVRDLSLHFVEPAMVPVRFLAQAPGTMNLSNLNLAFEERTALIPPVPSTGLCTPLPADPSELKSDDHCFCQACGSRQPMDAAQPVLTRAGRPALSGTCVGCGRPLIRLGGSIAASTSRESRLPATTVRREPVATITRAELTTPPLTEVNGIAEARAAQLEAIGIRSILFLANAVAADLANAIRGISVSRATQLIRDAQMIIDQSPLAQTPLVSCIMLTANRRRFVPGAIATFQQQEYPNAELLIIDDGENPVADLVPDDPQIRYIRLDERQSIGAKRNIGCESARGDIILHWDDDDWSAPWRVSYQVTNLLRAQADMCGLNRIYFFNLESEQAWLYQHPAGSKPWVSGGTMCYRKAIWARNIFPDTSGGAEMTFIRQNLPMEVLMLPDSRFYAAPIHSGNTVPKRTQGPNWQPIITRKVEILMGNEWPFWAMSVA